jgi:hypothetical protein
MIDPIRKANIGQPGIEADEHGDPVGKDPRQIDQAELRAVGHLPMPVLKAIRTKCLECCCGSPGEVRNCIVTSCPLWPYRMGSNPWRSPKVLSPEQRKRLIAAKNLRDDRGISSAGKSRPGIVMTSGARREHQLLKALRRSYRKTGRRPGICNTSSAIQAP